MRWASLACVALLAGCQRGDGNVIGSVRGGDSELVVTWKAPTAQLFLRSGGGASLTFPLLVKADAEMAIETIETGLRAAAAPAGDAVLAHMNAGRPELRVVASGGRVSLELGNRADAAPAPTFSIPLTPEVASGIEDLLRRTRDRLP